AGGMTFRLPTRARARAREIEGVPLAHLWPNLKLVSCWTSAASARVARALAERLPQALVQGKGLLATEAPMTLPLLGVGGFVPMIDEVFFELEDERGGVRLLHEAVDGEAYGVVLTQRGGLVRYRIGD